MCYSPAYGPPSRGLVQHPLLAPSGTFIHAQTCLRIVGPDLPSPLSLARLALAMSGRTCLRNVRLMALVRRARAPWTFAKELSEPLSEPPLRRDPSCPNLCSNVRPLVRTPTLGELHVDLRPNPCSDAPPRGYLQLRGKLIVQCFWCSPCVAFSFHFDEMW